MVKTTKNFNITASITSFFYIFITLFKSVYCSSGLNVRFRSAPIFLYLHITGARPKSHKLQTRNDNQKVRQ